MTAERRITAEEIRARAIAPDRNSTGISLEGAIIEDTLDLSATSLPSLAFVGCRFEREFILCGASVESLFLCGCDLVGIDARDAHLHSDLQLCEGTRSSGTVLLDRARIDGNLSCNAALLGASGGETLRADRAVIGGHVVMGIGCRASGAVALPHAPRRRDALLRARPRSRIAVALRSQSKALRSRLTSSSATASRRGARSFCAKRAVTGSCIARTDHSKIREAMRCPPWHPDRRTRLPRRMV